MRYILKFEEGFSTILLLLMSALAFVQVVTRYILKIPTPWIEETTRYLMVWMVFICTAAAVSKKAHLKVDVVDFFAPVRVARTINLILDIAMLIFGVIFTIITLQFTVNQIAIGQVSPAMQVSMALVYFAMVAGGLLFAVQVAYSIYLEFTGNAVDVARNEGSN